MRAIQVIKLDEVAGCIAYEAYRDHTRGVSAVTGDPLPIWIALPAAVRDAWAAAGAALAHGCDCDCELFG